MSTWRKLGLVLEAPGIGLAATHAMLPTPLVMDDRVRVFHACCDGDMRGRVFFADFEPEPPFRLMRRSRYPVLDVGPPGAFDCDGANPSQAFYAGGRLALLYIGWRRGQPETPYTLFAAVAWSDDGGASFERAAEPMLPPVPGERLFRTAPFIESLPEGFRMLYIGGDAFTSSEDGRRLPIYALREASSPSLWDWRAQSRVLLAPDLEAGELGFGRPVAYSVPGGPPKLLLSVRTRDGYRLVQTDRDFEPGVRPNLAEVVPGPQEAWERQMTCFGAPCTVGAHELLFYNGDGFGRTGMGLAWRPRAS